MNSAGVTPTGPSGRPASFDVRIWAIKEIRGRKTTYRVRGKVGGKEFGANFATFPLADSRRGELLAAARRGEAFDVELGIPVSELREVPAEPAPEVPPVRTWFEHARDFADVKWPGLAPGSRRSVAEALASVTPALLTADPPARVADLIREALYGWAFLTGQRTRPGPGRVLVENEPPAGLAEVLDWLASNTR
jgi:hypothetical protein